jgi:hypothetical protein
MAPSSSLAKGKTPPPINAPLSTGCAQHCCTANEARLRMGAGAGNGVGAASPGTVRLSSYQWRNEADNAEARTIKRRLQHGYRTEVTA